MPSNVFKRWTNHPSVLSNWSKTFTFKEGERGGSGNGTANVNRSNTTAKQRRPRKQRRALLASMCLVTWLANRKFTLSGAHPVSPYLFLQTTVLSKRLFLERKYSRGRRLINQSAAVDFATSLIAWKGRIVSSWNRECFAPFFQKININYSLQSGGSLTLVIFNWFTLKWLECVQKDTRWLNNGRR